AQLEEAMILRSLTPHKIAVLGGLPAGCEKEFKHLNLIPVLNTPDEVARCPDDIKSIWHIDTGMNRLGLDPENVPELLKSRPAPLSLMTHFSSSDEPDQTPSRKQVELFDSVAPKSIPHSLCNSAGIFRDASWHRQQVRAGLALYGPNPTPETINPMRPVVDLSARILQTKTAKAGSTVGYNRTHTFERDTQIAVLGIGYADGFHRAGSNKSVLYWNGVACPLVGRVSMDLVAVDLSPVAANPPHEGDWMEIIGPHQDADQLAASWNTIGYEVLTSLGGRAERVIIS
ncbi:MAG TPA: alanine racemase, partial [Alphaproteobacteria bacterium]|nr:alanine racemase [Alphaproteobacteria bacterium]